MHIARSSYVCTHALTYGYTFHEFQSPCALSYANGNMCFPCASNSVVSWKGGISARYRRTQILIELTCIYIDGLTAPTPTWLQRHTHTHICIHVYKDMCNLLSDILDDAVDDALAFFRISNLEIYETPDSYS